MKRIPRPDLTAAEAQRLGEELREARMALGVSVEDMAERIRIRRVYLLALEEGRLKELPGQAYVVGFLRNYANALGLDTDEVLRRFREVSVPSGKSNLIFPEPVPSRGVPAGAVMLAGAVLAIGAYVGWYNWSGGGNRVVDTVPPLPPRLEAVAPEPALRVPETQVGAATPSATRALPVAPIGLVPNPPVVVPTPVTPPPPTTPPAAVAATPAPDAVRITVKTRADAWIQLRDTRERRVLADRVLRVGETLDVPNREGLVLTVGRANSVDLLVDGNPTPALQGAVGVRRDIPMDPDRLRAGPLPAPPPAPRPTPRPTEASPAPG